VISAMLKRCVRKGGSCLLGRSPRVHRILFGPNKGKKIFISFDISPRMYFGVDEPYVAELAQHHVRPGDIVYDIGAHIGYTTLLFADRVGLSSSEQTLQLPVGETMMTSLYSRDLAGGGKNEGCRTCRLEDYVTREHLPLPALIKMDIEGAEIDCLEGGLEIIRNVRPKLIIEFHSLELLAKGIKILSPMGYILKIRERVIDEEFVRSAKWFHSNVFCSTNQERELADH